MTHVRQPETRTIRLERVYDGPVEDLWALWTTKEGLEEWFAPEGIEVEVTALELRIGGALDYVMTAVGDEAVAYMQSEGRPLSTRVTGQFVQIALHERLHLRMTIDFLPGVEPYPYNMVVELQSEGERVRMVVIADAHPDAEMTRLATQALVSQLQHFEAALAKRAR